MAQVGNSEDRFGGEYMVQDRDHLSESRPVTEKAKRGVVRQADQAQAEVRQQGGDRIANNRKASGGPRQSQ